MAEEAEQVQNDVLTSDLISEGLCHVEETTDGKGWAFTQLNVPGQNLTSIDPKLSTYSHLRHVDLSHNSFSDIDILKSLPNLVSANLNKNELQSVPSFKESVRLRQLRLDDNKLAELPSLEVPRLQILSVSGNQITNVEGATLSNTLTELCMARNGLTSFDVTTRCEHLKKIDLSENELTSVGSLSNFPNLETLVLKQNQLESLESLGSAARTLRTLDIGNNVLKDIKQFESLKDHQDLNTITIAGNEGLVEEYGDDLLVELILVLPQLRNVDGVAVSLDVRTQAAELRKQRKAEAEEAARVAAEEAAAAAAAAAEAKAEQE